MIVYKKLLIVLLISLGILPLFIKPSKVFADPVDITDSYFYYEKEVDNSTMNENQINMYSYLNWLQAAILVDASTGKKETDIMELLKYQDIYNEYVKNNIKITNNGQDCTIKIDESPVTEDQISLSLGTRVIGSYICASKIENVKIENKLFLTNFPYESNHIWINNGENLLIATTLGNNNQIYEFNASDLKNNPQGDKTVINSANLPAEQVTENLPDEFKVEANTKINTNTGTNGTVGSPAEKPSTSPVGPGPKQRSWLTTLSDTLYLKTAIAKDQSVPMLLILVLALGFLHTVEAGHSKTILASSMIHNRMSFKKGIAYATIFTITHLGDIIIVGLILLAVDNYFDILSHFSMIEKFAAYALLFMSVFLLFRNVQYFLKKMISKNTNLEIPGHVHIDANTEVTFKEQLALGFLAGLAPCVFGWTIFMLILSTNKIWVLVPAILCFGLGIFIALAFVVFLMTHLKKGAYGRFEKIAEISPLISALVLLVYAISLLT